MATQLAARGPNPDLLNAEAGPQQSFNISNIFQMKTFYLVVPKALGFSASQLNF